MPKYYRNSYPNYTKYWAVGDKPTGETDYDDNDLFPSAEIGVQASKFTPNWEWHNNKLQHINEPWDPDDVPDTLFHHHPAVVKSAFSHSSMRHTIPVLGMMAKMEFPDMVASDNLSPHSSRLAQKGMALGIVGSHEDNPYADPTNDIGFNNRGSSVSEGYSTSDQEVPAYTVKEARGNLKNILRPRKEHRDVMGSDQFNHFKLPGVD